MGGRSAALGKKLSYELVGSTLAHGENEFLHYTGSVAVTAGGSAQEQRGFDYIWGNVALTAEQRALDYRAKLRVCNETRQFLRQMNENPNHLSSIKCPSQNQSIFKKLILIG